MSVLHSGRLLDTGVLPAVHNMAINRALLSSRAAGQSPDTLRFLQFKPCVLVGYHQSVEQEIHRQYCVEHEIEIQRRVTGGGAIYFDPMQLGWELYCHLDCFNSHDLTDITTQICDAAAKGLQQLGLDARFRPRNDIEVNGRKISGTGGTIDGQAVLYQGTLIIDMDVEQMTRALRIPAEKVNDKALASARDRVTTLHRELTVLPTLEQIKSVLQKSFEESLNIRFEQHAGLSDAEQQSVNRLIDEYSTDEWIYQVQRSSVETPNCEARYKCKGGLLHVQMRVDQRRRRIKQCWIDGDIFVRPARLLNDLENHLRDCSFEKLELSVTEFFQQHKADMVSLLPADFIHLLQSALDQLQEAPA